MWRGFIGTVFVLVLGDIAWGQAGRAAPTIEVQKYAIEANINPRTQSVEATAKIDFTPLENSADATFELNNALTISKAADAQGAAVPTSRNPDGTVRVMFTGGLQKTQPVQVEPTASANGPVQTNPPAGTPPRQTTGQTPRKVLFDDVDVPDFLKNGS